MKKADLIDLLKRPILRCQNCRRPLLHENRLIADGCPCNSGRGINHGLVASHTCTCKECDPAQTGGARAEPKDQS